jgi:hypothetical protein
MENIPNIEFKLANIDEKIKDIIFFLTEVSIEKLQLQILDEYPFLEARLMSAKNNEEKAKIITKFFLHYQKDNKGKSQKAQKNFQKTWNSFNEEFMQTLSEVLEIDWPEEFKTIRANLSVSPICPISIDTREFDIYYKTKVKEMRDDIFPKVLALLYSEKWKQIFPEEELKFKNLAWICYEASVNAILSDSRFQNKFRYKNKPNPEYEIIAIDDNILLNHINKIYKEKSSFEDFLKTTWKFIQKNEKKIQEQLNNNL